jgi:hypothetical protein
MLELLEHRLHGVRDQKHGPLPAVIRVAAQAALLVIAKYYALSDDNEVYRIAIGKTKSLTRFTTDPLAVMCPDKKTAWFNENPDWRPEDRAEVLKVVQTRWEQSYSGLPSEHHQPAPVRRTNSVIIITSSSFTFANPLR